MLLGAIATLGLIVTAGAALPASGDIVPGSAQAVTPFTAGTPFSSGQTIHVAMPANSAFAGSHSGINIVECSAPDGVPPTNTSACDGNTIQGDTILPAADGSFTYDSYQLFALPDLTTLSEGSGGPACGLTAATECILYVGQNQNDFTQPHLWSQPFFITPDTGDLGTNPGDGSPPAVATVPDPGLSTAVAFPTTVTADGVDLATVNVTLLGASSVPVAGDTVTLTTPSSTAKVTGPSPAMTDANGQTTFTVTDTVAESVTLTAADPADSVTLTQKPTITFQAPKVDANHSSVTAAPANPPADGSTPTTITVTLRDEASNAQPVAGQTVTLSGTGSAVITPAATPNVTNASGVATFTATDASAEGVIFTATDTTESTVIANTASVTFGTLSVSASQSTVTASTPAPLGSAGTTAVVTLLSPTSSPVAGKVVSLTSSSTTAVIGTSSPSETGANGQVSFSVTDSVAEPVTLTATDMTDGVTLTSKPTVTFATGSPSATTSSVTAASTTSPADGETQTLITVTLNDQFGSPVSGKTTSLQGAPSGNVELHPITADSATTDSSGEAEFDVSDSHAETVTFTATDTTDNLVVSKTVAVTFTPGPPDTASQGTTVSASPTNPPSDGSTPTTITVTLTDHFSNPIAGKTISLAALNGKSNITTVSGVTNPSGQATFTATDSTAEIVTYQATDVTDGNAVLAADAVVKFGKPPVPPPVAADCSVVANPTSVPADGTTTATVSVLLYDGNGDPVSGKTVTVTGSGGGSKVTATNATTNNMGMASFAVSDTTAESVKYTADDTSDSLDLSAIPVTVTFTAAAAASTTTTTTTTSSTTTTTSSSTTSTTGATGLGVTSPGVSTAGTAGNTGAGGTGSSLAVTGSSTLLVWLTGLGGLLVGIGTIGRRRFKGERNGL